MKKKAEITTHQLVLLIVLIIGFVIILFLLFRLNMGKESDKEICHNAVMERATLVKTPFDADSVPLNCQREYVCITKDGSCEELLNPTKKKVKSEPEIYKVLAEELRNCWWMFGEGNVKFIDGTALKSNYCAVCSQIKFDNSIKEIISLGTINKEDFYKYLASTKVPEKKITYLEYLYKTNSLNDLFGEAVNQGASLGQFDISKSYYSFMVIPTEISAVSWGIRGAATAAIGVIAVATTIGTGGLAAPIWIGVATAAGGLSGAVFVTPVVRGLSGSSEIIPPNLIEAPPSEEIEAFKCDEISTKS